MNEEDIQALESWRDSLSTGAIPVMLFNFFFQILCVIVNVFIFQTRPSLGIASKKHQYFCKFW
jgi:hypothetical protein